VLWVHDGPLNLTSVGVSLTVWLLSLSHFCALIPRHDVAAECWEGRGLPMTHASGLNDSLIRVRSNPKSHMFDV
jgi:hypothetical protein